MGFKQHLRRRSNLPTWPWQSPLNEPHPHPWFMIHELNLHLCSDRDRSSIQHLGEEQVARMMALGMACVLQCLLGLGGPVLHMFGQ